MCKSTFILGTCAIHIYLLFHFSMEFPLANRITLRIAPDGTHRSTASHHLGLFCLYVNTANRYFQHFSTISSGLNSIAACVLQDVIRAYFVKDMTEKRATLVSRILGRIQSAAKS